MQLTSSFLWALSLACVGAAGCSLDTERFSFDGTSPAGGSGAGGIGSGGVGNGGSGDGGSGAMSAGGDGGGGMSGCEPGTMVSCFSGDPVNAGVGICETGTTVCTDEGMPGPDCNGEVLPAVENCDAPLDEDCDGFACSETMWAIVAGDVEEQNGNDVAVDPNTGEVYVTGSFRSSMTLGNETLVADFRDAYVAKIAPDGTPIWFKQFGSAGSQFGGSIAVDSQGNVIVSGTNSGTLDFGFGAVGEDWLVKLDSNGDAIWSLDCTIPGNNIRAIAVDQNDDSIVVGAGFSGTNASCGNQTFDSNGGQDIILSKFSASGVPLWSDQYGGTGSDNINAVAVSSSGNIYIGGEFQNSIVFGNIVRQAPGNTNVFVARFDENGTYSWDKGLGDNATNQTLQALAVGPAGEVVIGGVLGSGGSITAAGGPNVTTGNMYIIAFAAGGAHIWSDGYDNLTLVPIRDIDVAPNGDVHVVGTFGSLLQFGTGQLNGPGGNNGYIARLNGTNGAHVWSKRVGNLASSDFADVIRLALGPQGEVHLAGNAEGSIILVDPALPTSARDMFVAKIAP